MMSRLVLSVSFLSVLTMAGCGGTDYENLQVCNQNGCGARNIEAENVSVADKMATQTYQPLLYKGENLEDLRQQAASGNGDAAALLGIVHSQGLAGQPRNPQKAYHFFEQAASQGSSTGLYYYGLASLDGKGGRKNTQIGIESLQKAHEMGEVPASWTLGTLFQKGQGVQKNEAEAFRYFKFAADAGDSNALLNVGLMYAMGSGVQSDPYKATVMLEKSASNGNVTAQKTLGFLQSRGEQGIVRDLQEARRWLSLAAAKGDKDAGKELGYVNEELNYQDQVRFENQQQMIRQRAYYGYNSSISLLNSWMMLDRMYPAFYSNGYRW